MPYGVDAVEQFQVVTSGGQAELGRALGGYVNVVTRSGTNQLRGTAYGYFRDDALQRRQRAVGDDAADVAAAVRRQPRRADRARPHVLLRQRRAAAARPDRASRPSAPANAAIVNARLAAVGYPGAPVAHRHLRQPGRHACNLLGKVDHAFTGRDQLSVRYSLYDVASDNSRGAGGLSAPSASSGLDNRDQAVAVSNTLTIGDAHGQRDARAVHPQRPAGAADRSGRPGREHRRRGHRSARFASSPQGRLNRMFQVVEQRRAAARRACAARRRRRASTTTTASPSRAPCAAPTRSRRWPTS